MTGKYTTFTFPDLIPDPASSVPDSVLQAQNNVLGGRHTFGLLGLEFRETSGLGGSGHTLHAPAIATSEITPRDLALASAESTALATTEILRFAREGDGPDGFAFDAPTLPMLADALATLANLESERAMLPSDKEALGQLAHACRNFQMDFSQ